MIDFGNKAVFKLKPIDISKTNTNVQKFLVDGEKLLMSFKALRDQVVFTNKRIIAINVQGITGSKQDFTSIPYSKIQTYSIETAGTLDLDAELELYLSSVGRVKFEIKGNADIIGLNRVISEFIL